MKNYSESLANTLGIDWADTKSTPTVEYKNTNGSESLMTSSMADPTQFGILKAYVPEYLYKPYFGYPLPYNPINLRKLGLNSYVFSAIKTLKDEAASTDYDLELRKGVEETEEMKEHKKNFLMWIDDPNENPESFMDIMRMTIEDVSTLDAGVWVKVFNMLGQMNQVYARDGGTFLKNPDIHGTFTNRVDYVKPADIQPLYVTTMNPMGDLIKRYETDFNKQAAYYQYGYTHASLPVPFGKREIVYFMNNPRTDSIYGRSPLVILSDIITSLVYGARYNLDWYINSDVPEGILSIAGIQQDQKEAVRARLSAHFKAEDEFGNDRRIRGRMPITDRDVAYTSFNVKPVELEIIAQQEWFIKLVWACFGVVPSEMGFTEDSNKAVDQNQSKVHIRKALRPMLKKIQYKITSELMTEEILYSTYDGEKIVIPPLFKYYKFVFDEYDLDEDLKKHDLFKKQIDMGIKTSEMVAEENNIDIVRLRKEKDESHAREMEKMGATTQEPIPDPKKKKTELKGTPTSTDELDPIKKHIRSAVGEIMDVIDNGLI